MSAGGDVLSERNSKDQAIKLFGRTIPLLESQISAQSKSKQPLGPYSDFTNAEQAGPCKENSGQPEKFSSSSNHEKNPAPALTNQTELNSKLEEEKLGTNDAEDEKVFKKPDKIIPCPRCDSLDTKFCYFNNYNVNQPRHFCKNCHRYWTAGGTMRNVPVGAGRRRNKQIASQYRQMIVSADGVPITSGETTESANHQLISCVESSTTLSSSTGNGAVLEFGSETPIRESMETVLSLEDQKSCLNIASAYCGNNLEEPSPCGSSVTTSSNMGNELPETGERGGVVLSGPCSELNSPATLQCYPIPPLVVPLNPGWNNPATVVAVPGFYPPGIPLQFVPAAYWGCMPVWNAGTGNSTSNGCTTSMPSTDKRCSPANGLPTLGKHSRDANFEEEGNPEKCVLVPKTLRVDDPNEASKSPIWATLGLLPYQKEAI